MSLEESLRSLSLDYLNLLINGHAFSDVTFSVEGRLVHAHKCILAARSTFFRKFFCGSDHNPSGNIIDPSYSVAGGRGLVIPVNSVGYEVFILMLQFLYCGQVSVVPQKHEPRPNCREKGCWHTHCTSAVDLALDTLSAARSFGVEPLSLLTQKQLAIMVEKASIDDVMKVLIASRKQEDMHHLWTTCSHLVAKSGLPPQVLSKHLPIDVVTKIEELRFKSSLSRRSLNPRHHHHYDHNHDQHSTVNKQEDQRIHRMRRAIDSSDVELVKLMVMGEGLNLNEALGLHYAVENSSREVVKALLELGVADVNYPAGPDGKTPLHLASEMVSPDMVAVLLDHHADPNVRTLNGITPLDVLRTLTSDFLFKGMVPGLIHIQPNKLRLCLELVQSAAMVISREEGTVNTDADVDANAPATMMMMYPAAAMATAGRMSEDHTSSSSSGNMGGLNNVDSRMFYFNIEGGDFGGKMSGGDDFNNPRSHGGCDTLMYHHHHNHHSSNDY